MRHGQSRMVRTIVLLTVCLALSPSAARADFSWDEVLAIIAGEKFESWLGTRTEKQEKNVIEAAYEAYYDKQGDFVVAKAMIGGSPLSFLPDGVDTLLTFSFEVASTGEVVTLPGLASVRYEKQTDPPTPIPGFELLGVSADIGGEFALPFTLGGFEPVIRAVPLDGLGNPLLVAGANGSDVSVGVAINLDLSPPGVPDGTIGQPLRVRKLDPAGLSLELSWDATTCVDAIDHQIVFGLGSQLPSVAGEVLELTGAVCAVGSDSPYVWNNSPDPVGAGDDTRLLWFLVVATDGLQTEGAWGLGVDGQERVGPDPGGSSAMCGIVNKSLAYNCGNGTCDVDIRTTIEGSRNDPAAMQLNYDGINRAKHLYGLVPFEQFLGASLDELAPQFMSRLAALESCTGLSTDEGAIATTYLGMAVEALGLSVGEIIALLPGELPALQAKIAELRSFGIGFPRPALTEAEAAARAAAVGEIVEQAGRRRYRDFYFLIESDLTPVELFAIDQGKSSGVLKMAICAPDESCEPADSFGICDNDRCCSSGTGEAGSDECKMQTDKHCNLPPPSRAYCSIGSDKC